MPDESCGSCRFYRTDMTPVAGKTVRQIEVENGFPVGECHRHPPRRGGDGHPEYPPVWLVEDWCGEYRTRDNEKGQGAAATRTP